ncbi:hypothetical protein ACUJ46_10190 [Sandaracinobacteroides sp. A072]|uniref:hypothetical protein n=1 Tax=Sandaracinobacteroides sp. A072 TaxID=3461146 RepID=UPI0040433031
MSFEATMAACLAMALVLILSAFMNARRGIGRWSLVPWDYAMLLSALLLIVSLAHLAGLWRQGLP